MATVTYAIYEHPADYPEGYVVRAWSSEGGAPQPGEGQKASTLEEARALLPPDATKIDIDDPDPVIVETYLASG